MCAPVGDCFFACMSFWTNAALGRTLFTAALMRIMCAANLTDDAAEFLVAEMCSDEDPCISTREGLVGKITDERTWANHTLIHITLRGISALLGRLVGLVVLRDDSDVYIHIHTYIYTYIYTFVYTSVYIYI